MKTVLETIVGAILIVGALSTASLIAVGSTFAHYATNDPNMSNPLRTQDLASLLSSIASEIVSGQYSPRMFVDLAIAIMMLTPYAAVASSTTCFLAQKKLKHAAMGALVCIILTYWLIRV